MKFNDFGKPFKIVLGVLAVILLGGLDTLTGQVASFSVFYIIPIYLITWYVGRWPGAIISVFSALAWLAADYISSQTQSHFLIPIWNMIVRLCSFLLISYLLSEIKKHDTRRRSLERIFFHDILNVVGSLRGYAELLRSGEIKETKEIYDLLYQSADRSIEDIEAQRLLASAESEDLYVELSLINSEVLIKLLLNLYQHQEVASGKVIKIDTNFSNIDFESDQGLLSRILGNMIKNALESTDEGGVVIVSCSNEKDKICFWVQNNSVIPESMQKNIFKQHVSTKNKNRGIGTYSMKLLTECLNGQVSFVSNKQEGTIFKACYPIRFPKH